MPGTRRSARQAVTSTPKYTESSSDETRARANGKKATRRKRARDEDEDTNDNQDLIAEDSPPPQKKAVKRQAPKASKSATTKSTSTAPPTSSIPAKTTVPLPVASSDTNRDVDGNQEVYWLLKAEPLPRYENGINVAFSIDDLKACTKPEPWGGVRNPQARNNMQAMRKGDLGFFYHSNAKPSGVVGILKVVEEAKIDETAFDPKDPYYDAKSDRSKPKWYCVGVEFVEKFDEVVDLHKIKSLAGKGDPLEHMQLVSNSRLSVCRVRKGEWDFILDLAKEKGK